MLCVDASTTENTQRAGIEFALPAGRFEWIAEGWFNPTALDLTPNGSIHLLRFLSGEDLSVAARIFRHEGGLLLAGIIVDHVPGVDFSNFRPDRNAAAGGALPKVAGTTR